MVSIVFAEELMSHVIEVKCINNPAMVIKSVLGNEIINILSACAPQHGQEEELHG